MAPGPKKEFEEQLHFRLTAEDKAALDAIAEREGVKVGALLREAVAKLIAGRKN